MIFFDTVLRRAANMQDDMLRTANAAREEAMQSLAQFGLLGKLTLRFF